MYYRKIKHNKIKRILINTLIYPHIARKNDVRLAVRSSKSFFLRRIRAISALSGVILIKPEMSLVDNPMRI